MRLVALISSLILTALFAILAWQNATPVQFVYPGGVVTLPLAVLMALVLGTGWVFGVITMVAPGRVSACACEESRNATGSLNRKSPICARFR